MHLHFEFAEAEVAQCFWQDSDLHIRFSAAPLWPAENPQAEMVWAPMSLVAKNVESWGLLDTAQCMGKLRQGAVLHASKRLQRLPLPCDLQGVVTMELEFVQAGLVHVRCNQLTLRPVEGDVVSAYQC